VSDNQDAFTLDSDESDFDIKTILYTYLQHWKWIVLSVAITMTYSWFQLRKQVPLYEADATVLVKSSQSGDMGEMAMLKGLGLGHQNNNVENEIELFKSRSLISLMIQDLKLNITYHKQRRSFDLELFNNKPITLSVLVGDSFTYDKSETIRLIVESASTFRLLKGADTKGELKRFGEVFPSNTCGEVLINANESILQYLGSQLSISIQPLEATIGKYKNKITVMPLVAKSNIINISLTDVNKDKAVAIIDNLIKQHNTDGLKDKNSISENTSKFIDERIRFITSELYVVESDVESFKVTNKLVDVDASAQAFMNGTQDSKSAIMQLSMQQQLVTFLLDHLNKQHQLHDFMPSNLGVQDESITSMIVEYNNLLLEQNRLFKSSTSKNPVVIAIEDKLIALKNGIKINLANLQRSLKVQLDGFNSVERKNDIQLATVPKLEKDFRSIERQRKIKEALYLLLLQKREETNIAMAVTVGNLKVIDHAYSNGGNMATPAKKVYTPAFLVGFALPIMVIFLLQLLDNKIHGRKEIDKLKIPYAGDIPFHETDEKLIVTKLGQSSVAEAFRLLRTNIGFLLKAKEKGNTIFVTSTIAGEGKSFVALNVASIIANTGKSVLLIGMDLRSPKVLAYFGLTETGVGVSNYISNDKIKLDDVIISAPSIDNLDLLPSGAIPPNPAELLLDERVEAMFLRLKSHYDYIIVDTAPVSLVTDTLLLSRHADMFIYVMRDNFLDKRLLSVAKGLYNDKKLPNMAIVLNGTGQHGSYGYGYGYGYGQAIEQKKWYQTLFSK
jgi:tyrosine-protein kinase Etk/Wzc